ncbi:hypothetical protein HNR46_001243 [Haloferula luteola]|uniref:Uncharacterized protein n=1 Tax=Haloferula luteola TaxID=595692 RepID=A0A840VB29_9BACT|nr:hypothetical protein [Haloferula luteola]MBB5351009.1 hypothetical protein [Haloferula luteola]
MCRSTCRPARPLPCTGVHFAEVEFPRVSQPRLVIEFREVFSLLLADEGAIPLAAEVIAAFRHHLARKGGRSC